MMKKIEKDLNYADGAWMSSFLNDSTIFSDLNLPKNCIQPEGRELIKFHLPKENSFWNNKVFSNNNDTEIIIRTFKNNYLLISKNKLEILAGVTREIIQEKDTPLDGSPINYYNSIKGVELIKNSSKEILPILDKAEIKEIYFGLRPVSKDGMPILDKFNFNKDTIVTIVGGLGSDGLLLGPYFGKLACDLKFPMNKNNKLTIQESLLNQFTLNRFKENYNRY